MKGCGVATAMLQAQRRVPPPPNDRRYSTTFGRRGLPRGIFGVTYGFVGGAVLGIGYVVAPRDRRSFLSWHRLGQGEVCH